MSFLDVQTALDTKLQAFLSGGQSYPVAWEGTNYEPTLGTIFLRPTNLTGTSVQQDLINSSQNNVGIYQIDVFHPLTGEGTGAFLSIIDDLYNHFKDELTLSSGGTEVYIRNISRLPTADSEKAWMIGGIQINYSSYF